jgi:pimeloyl-ACP methyl ester carboxylesterase
VSLDRSFSDPALAAFAAANPTLDLAERFVSVAPGVRLHVVEAGPAGAVPILLLHGFPEFWWGWRKQISALAAAPARLIVPDLRGYNLSDKPRGIAAYRVSVLARDLTVLLDHYGIAKARLAAHDWGAAAVWWALQEYPERFERAVIVNAPALPVLKRALWTSREQRRRGAYLFYFQLPLLPERKIAAGGFRPFRSIFKRSSPPGTFTPEELEVYAAAAARPGALRAMLHWYRAALWLPPRSHRRLPIETPVRLLWGTGDVALPEALVAPTAARCAHCEVVRIPDGGHWVTHTAAAEVNRQLLDFLA